MRFRPLGRDPSRDFIRQYHRHLPPTQGYKFALGLEDEDEELIGVVVVGRPVARALDDGFTAEVTRLCVRPGVNPELNVCSRLYGAARRAAKAMGYTQLYTYTLKEEESGVSPLAAGFEKDGEVRGRSWSTPSRPRDDDRRNVDKIRWRTDL